MELDWAFSTAKDLMAAMASGTITSRALLELYIGRVEAHNGAFNAVVATNYEAARARADAADQARQKGESWGPLHGLPMTIKDTFEVEGMPCTAGYGGLRNHVPLHNAVAAQRLLDAGAILFAKTNVPLFASDIQTFNRIYGTTNNPWATELTPGGSSGGAAAALAAGFTPLELGSDLAGSIRTPSSYCGVYGHKSTHGIISLQGHVPGPPGTLSESDLAVVGPMARSAADLNLMMEVVAGAMPSTSPGWVLKLPKAKQKKLSDFKVLWWTNDPLCPLDSRMVPVYDRFKQQLLEQGVSITDATQEKLSLERYFPTYMNLLGSVVAAAHKKMERQAMVLALPLLKKVGERFNLPFAFEEYLAGVSQSHVGWSKVNERRFKLRAELNTLFNQFDVVLMPVTMTLAFKHLQKPDVPFRKLIVDGRKLAYSDLFMWVAPASMAGLPASSAPVGRSADGLPVNIQIMGGAYQDLTTIKFAELMEKAFGGFVKPPGM